ncbi:hypothetical protein SAMN04488021_16410 [Paracoccus aminovorans]|uniref:Uncharacterized protein n=1 Tax=Paracoccus aminovorans TaxID=34004 RepID=A0A1I3F8I6_9RHOB|nr:hypothetical protein [Paracoccus aminovorans]CQR87345.1 hypothetical protein JCM7685_2802 [Paracoccus aminovorans]SFI07507.1 hypothetical protein SAMN04488021_16410 [Paracoccus aminovorans]
MRAASDILRDTPPPVHESFRLDRAYRYGTGLEIVLDIPAIDRAAIECAIHRFRECGETDWQSPTPIPRDHPRKTEAEILARARKQGEASQTA